MSLETKYIKPKKFYDVFHLISDELHDITLHKLDRELFYDRIKFIEGSVDWDEYKSNDEFDKDNIYHTDVRTISELIGQVVIFGRIIRENQYEETNLPKGEVPLFHRQIDDNGNEEDLWDISSGEIIKRWSKKKKGKKKLREVNRYL